jgi:hypothetical protein
MEEFDLARGIPDSLGTADIGRFGGGVTRAMRHWAIEGVLYMMVLGSGYGALIGFVSRKLLNIASKRYVTDDALRDLPLTSATGDGSITNVSPSCLWLSG